MEDREEISRGLAEGVEFKEIAARLARDPSVVSQEVARHGGRCGYRAAAAQQSARARRSRHKTMAVDRSPRLRGRVQGVVAAGLVAGFDRGPVAERASRR